MIEMNQKLYFSLLKRYSLLMAGLAVMAFGVAFSIKASLGTSPISSVPYVVSLFAPLTVGTATIVMHCVFILLQILILRKNYHPIQLMQLPVAFFFGYLTDFGMCSLDSVYRSSAGGERRNGGSGASGGADCETAGEDLGEVEIGMRMSAVSLKSSFFQAF